MQNDYLYDGTHVTWGKDEIQNGCILGFIYKYIC